MHLIVIYEIAIVIREIAIVIYEIAVVIFEIAIVIRKIAIVTCEIAIVMNVPQKPNIDGSMTQNEHNITNHLTIDQQTTLVVSFFCHKQRITSSYTLLHIQPSV